MHVSFDNGWCAHAIFIACIALIQVPAHAANVAEAVDAGVAAIDENLGTANETIVMASSNENAMSQGRAQSVVRRSDIDRRLPRSAPDALRYEPGVFVQQTAHGQASAFIRGLTGQQTLLLFDGIRLNNSTYRQGPNQYFFTLDSRTIESIDVLRGGASTQYGSDALGGVVAANPLEPSKGSRDFVVHPSAFLRGATADKEYGGRAQIDFSKANVAFVGGVGGRRAGLLESAGPIANPADGKPTDIPRFAADGRSQLGTGFNELTYDGRIVTQLGSSHQLTLAAYGYQQYQAPRTDQCPPVAARFDECLMYDEQFRHLVYGAWDGSLGALAKTTRVSLSWQRQHERRTHSRPASFVVSRGRDDVDTFGLVAKFGSAEFPLEPWLLVSMQYGVDAYFDSVRSLAWLSFTDIAVTVARTRGQYLSGSTYLYGGAYVDFEANLWEVIVLRAGGRVSSISARAPADRDSGSLAVRRDWQPLVGHVGVEWAVSENVSLLANADRSFRAPNLDDLTSRQQTGPGFQFENAALRPESAATLEVGTSVRSRVASVDAWGFVTRIDDVVGKMPMEVGACPLDTPQCQASWFRYQLTNGSGTAQLMGLELALKLRLPFNFTARATAAFTTGDGPNFAVATNGSTEASNARVPLSRIPPPNGTAELQWHHRIGIGAGAALRWATLQDRLAIADRSDGRIPLGGTPGFAVVDLRMSYRLDKRLVVAGVFENIFDAAYRVHGSSVNGPGRGLVVSLEYSPF